MSQGVFPKEALNFIFFCNSAIFFVGFACLVKKDTHFILIFNLLVYSSKHFCEAGGSNFIISLWQMRKLRQRKLERFALRLKWTLLDHSLSFPTPDFLQVTTRWRKYGVTCANPSPVHLERAQAIGYFVSWEWGFINYSCLCLRETW